MKLLLSLCLLAFANIIAFNSYAQFINQNANVKVNQEAYIVVRNIDFRNVDDGTVDNDGHIVLNGANWVNDGNNNMLINLNQDGEVKMTGTKEQSIKGKNKTIFETLTLWAGPKKLEISGCEVNNKLDLLYDGVLDLNQNRFIINSKKPEAVAADITSYILSENIDYDYSEGSPNDNVYGELQWNIGDNVAAYTVPFGSKDKKKLDLTVKLTSKGEPETGNIVFATYPTNYLNMPLSSEVNSLEKLPPESLADRFWKIKANYGNKPNVDIKFKVSDSDLKSEHIEMVNNKSVSLANNPGLSVENLLALRYNSNSKTWLDMQAKGSYNETDKTVDVNGIGSGDFYTWWMLTTKSKLEVSNIFTPNNDGHNDVFIPQFAFSKDGAQDPEINAVEGIFDLQGKIFSRWGNVIYEWNNKDWWDGKYKGSDVPEGTYFYVITAKGTDGKNYNEKGSVTLLRN